MPFTGIMGGLLGGGLNMIGQAASNSANAKEAAKNRAWQEQMSNTAHQRQVADMRAAGINPMLSGMGGSGASTGSGAQATMQNVGSAGVQGFSQGIQSSASAAQAKVARQEANIKTSAVGKEAHAYGMYIKMGIPKNEAKVLAAAHSVERHRKPIMGLLQKAYKITMPKVVSARHRASERKKYAAYVAGLPKSNPHKYKKRILHAPKMAPPVLRDKHGRVYRDTPPLQAHRIYTFPN